MKTIKIRAHHLLCIPRFYSGGYNKTFSDNMKNIVMQIRKNPDVKIKVISGKSDVLCDKCPHWYNKKCNQSPEVSKWVLLEDKRALGYLKLKENSIHKGRDVFNRSMEKFGSTNILSVCKNCIFLDNCLKVGINNSFRKDINKKSK